MKRLVFALFVTLFLLTACSIKLQKTETNVSVPNQNATTSVEQSQEVHQNVSVVEAPSDKPTLIASTPFTMYNDKQQKFKFGSYIIELLYVATDGSGCQLRINGKSSWYNKDEDTSFDEGLKVRVMQATPTHGYGGDACQVIFL